MEDEATQLHAGAMSNYKVELYRSVDFLCSARVSWTGRMLESMPSSSHGERLLMCDGEGRVAKGEVFLSKEW